MDISICIATYKRPELLKRLLDSIGTLETRGLFSYSVTIVDNDCYSSGKEVAQKFLKFGYSTVQYLVEPARSIARVRNAGILNSKGEAIAFIDDDEFPEPDWLLQLHNHLVQDPSVAGILGPVRPHYPNGTPAWVRNGGFFERPEHPTGRIMAWGECRTGNVIFWRKILPSETPAFDEAFATGGSDLDFFRRRIAEGHRFAWCNEAIVHEVVPPSRWKRRVLIKRALLRGRNSYRHPENRFLGVTKAAFAIPIYVIALPFLFLVGHHLFMRYLIKLCDHAGRLLAAFHIYPVTVREM